MLYRLNKIPSAWRELERVQQQMNRIMSDPWMNRFETPATFPPMNVYSNKDGIMVTAEVPGLGAEDIEISVVGETLTISGARKPVTVGDDYSYHRQERISGEFTRTVELPHTVDAEKVDARMANGILNIFMPRVEADKPRKIAVKTA